MSTAQRPEQIGLNYNSMPAREPNDSSTTSELQAQAERWRTLFEGAIRCARNPTDLQAELAAGIERRAWTHLRDEKGHLFTTFERFCSCEPPAGLGLPHHLVLAFLTDLIGERRTDRLTADASHQGRAIPETSRQHGGKSDRENQRLRAVEERAPEIVKHLHDLKLMSLDQAAWFGAKAPTKARKAAIDDFAWHVEGIVHDLGDAPTQEDRDRARELVLKLLPQPKDTAPAKVMRQIRRLSAQDQDEFEPLVRAWLLERRRDPANDIGGEAVLRLSDASIPGIARIATNQASGLSSATGAD